MVKVIGLATYAWVGDMMIDLHLCLSNVLSRLRAVRNGDLARVY